ncbi:gluconate permease [Bacilli bacterium]|uniref:gluconate:H+ symporter n=1 Tax=Oceanobacillus sp. FSL K6-0118 TaxID=2921418 RepID=UPI000622A18B|nr:gluconate permease [Bacilli bacterium VT-13-104]PZD86429.1 gluconate permease [Bacilli bacterium]PZD88079.1 gluconate permease [Bacilli bacterium]PZD90981.1 gluconate permease [Bacilli bacterium]RCO05058.1 gluconate permease [Bacilli bacterium]
MENILPLIVVALGVVVLLFLITKLEINTFISLVITAFLVALGLGMPLEEIVESIQGGMGGTLGSIALIFGFGAILGKLVADAGGAQRIAGTLIDKFGEKQIQWAVVIASFIIGIALFFEVGLVLLIPIVFQIAKQLKVSPLYLGIPMATALSVTHGFLPPHPGPTVIAQQYDANIGMVLVFGIIISIPAVIIAGPLFAKIIQKMIPDSFNKAGNIDSLGETKTFKIEETPGFGISVLTSLLPVILMAISTVVELIQDLGHVENNVFFKIIYLIGEPTTALLISVLLAVYTMGVKRNIPMKQVMASAEESIRSIGMMLLIIGGGGVLKQVLIDGGVGDSVAALFADSHMSPLFLAWLIAAILRIALGSATVAALTTAGLVIPLMQGSGIDPALMVLATGAGSLIASHVNDAGFWMFKEFFGLTLKETFSTWTLLESVISVVGLVGVLVINMFV